MRNPSRRHRLALCGGILVAQLIGGRAVASNAAPDFFVETGLRKEVIERSRFIQIPGPNPILVPGAQGAWDDGVVEAADAFRDVDTYYFYYHATGAGKGYRLGVASAKHPLGPFEKHGDIPVVNLGDKGHWDDKHVACAYVMKVADEEYYMWYSGCGDRIEWSIGLATASHPLGPWKKHEGNPVLKDFGYLGGVINVAGKYHLYSAHPIHMPWAQWEEGRSRSATYHTDYSPLAVAIGDSARGPFEAFQDNPLMVQGSLGDWDDGGISEAEVLYHNGMFHMFYGATERFGPRTEDIGYAYSFDGLRFYKYGSNPVAVRGANPNAAAFAEVHAIVEPPFVYLYHTLRYEQAAGHDFPWTEHLGVQVLATQTPFSLDMPMLDLKTLGPGETTTLTDCPPVSLGHVAEASVTVECTYSDTAAMAMRVHVRASYDGINYDSIGLDFTSVDVRPGKTARKTMELDTNLRFIKVLIENPDGSESVSDVKIIASLKG